MAETGSQERELSRTQQLIGMTEPGKPPENVEVRVSEPGTGRWLVGPAGGELRYEDEVEAEKRGTSEAGTRRAVRARGVEPPRAEAHRDLNPARLPIPPHPRRSGDRTLGQELDVLRDAACAPSPAARSPGRPRWISATNSSSVRETRGSRAAASVSNSAGVRQYEARPRACAASRTM